LAYFTTQWAHKNRELRAIKAFKTGMAPIVMALLIATGWLLSTSQNHEPQWPLWLTTAIATLLVWRTKIHLLILLGIGALLGGFGLI
jgi:chromate transporter